MGIQLPHENGHSRPPPRCDIAWSPSWHLLLDEDEDEDFSAHFAVARSPISATDELLFCYDLRGRSSYTFPQTFTIWARTLYHILSINTDGDIWSEWTSYRCRGFHWCWARSVDHRTPPHWKYIRPLPDFHADQPCKPSGRIHSPQSTLLQRLSYIVYQSCEGGIHTILRAGNHVTHGHSTVNHVDISTSGFTRDLLMDCSTFWLLPSNAMDFHERNRRKDMQMHKPIPATV